MYINVRLEVLIFVIFVLLTLSYACLGIIILKNDEIKKLNEYIDSLKKSFSISKDTYEYFFEHIIDSNVLLAKETREKSNEIKKILTALQNALENKIIR